MAKRPKYSVGKRLTTAETVLGWCYLPVYLVLLSVGILKLFLMLRVTPTQLNVNLTFFAVNLLFVLLVFQKFLRQKFFGKGFWNYVQTLILSFVLYYAGNLLLTLIAKLCGTQLTALNDQTVLSLVEQSRYVMLIATVFAAPIVEETLIRGVVFGSLHPVSRVLAYFMSCFLFVFMHNWQYLLQYPLRDVLLSCLPYIPAAAALGWCYEKAETIWAPIALHAIINAISFGVLTLG